MKKRSVWVKASLFLMIFGLANILQAQGIDVTKVSCGSIIQNELVSPDQTGAKPHGSYPHQYSISLSPGDKISFDVSPIGSSLDVAFTLYDPMGTPLTWSGWGNGPGQTDKAVNYEVSATGDYIIGIAGNTLGAYTLSIGCVLRNGTVIKPGDAPPNGGINKPTSTPAFSGNGFPGLQPVDFSSAFILPLNLGQMNNGQIPTAGNAVLAFTFTGNAGQKADFQYIRPSGNLNLGIVVLSPTGKVVFQSSLISSDLLITRFILPESGQYTIGVFKVDLVPPATPEATSFQLQVGLT